MAGDQLKIKGNTTKTKTPSIVIAGLPQQIAPSRNNSVYRSKDPRWRGQCG